MCGIFGAISSLKNRLKESDLGHASDLLSHRGPDGRGIFIEDRVQFAHCRLAIFDVSTDGAQPMTCWGKTITYNGAIYNFLELREDLRNKGYSFKTDTDTEVVLAMYDYYGEDCTRYFNGQWAFAIYDPQRSTVFCSRDRFGINFVYYWENHGDFYFSSEIKAFTVLPGWQAKLNRMRAYEFLAHGMHDHTNETFFEGVNQLPKGANLIYDLKKSTYQIIEYYSVKSVQVQESDESSVLNMFNMHLSRSIALRSRADVPIGAALSGGLDSSSIVLRYKSSNQQVLQTFSVVYSEAEISEEKYLNDVLELGKFESHRLSPSHQQFEDSIDKVLWHQEEPFDGMGVIAQFHLFKHASTNGVKVMLDGQGADEILAGYEKFYWPLIKTETRNNPIGAWRLLRSIMRKNKFSYFQSYILLTQYLQKEKIREQTWLKIPFNRQESFLRKPDSTVLETSKNLLSDLGISALLRYEHKNAMAHGVESRTPFLDHHLVEFCLSLPNRFKIRNGVRKWILRESGRDLLPQSLLARTDKLGFATPEKKWLKEKGEYYRESIKSNKLYLAPYVDLDRIGIPSASLTWRLFVFGKWIKMFDIS